MTVKLKEQNEKSKIAVQNSKLSFSFALESQDAGGQDVR
jgi:hypothetical protein